MRFDLAVDRFIDDMQASGRLQSRHSEAAYRAKLIAHAKDVDNRDPSKTGREDIKKTLRRWKHPNSQLQAHAVLKSFYTWCEQEGIRETNPARQVQAAKPRAVTVYRMTRGEVVRFLDTSTRRRRDRWVAHLGVLAGLRSQELRGLQRRHFMRDGWIWVSADIAKGARERWVPVLPELEQVVTEILEHVDERDHYVVPGMRNADPPGIGRMIEKPLVMLSASGLHRQVKSLGERAGIAAAISPHSMRHAYGDHVAKHAGLRVAQALLGHVSVETTASTYTDRVTLDELAASVDGFAYRFPIAVSFSAEEKDAAARKVFDASRARPADALPEVAFDPVTLTEVAPDADDAIAVPVPFARGESDVELFARCSSLVTWAINEHSRGWEGQTSAT